MFGIDNALLFWVAVTLPLFAFWVAAMWDLVFRRDLPFIKKLVWAAVIVFGAYVGLAAYFIARPIPEPPGKSVGDSVPRTSAIVTELERLAQAHADDAIADEAYLARKRELLGA